MNAINFYQDALALANGETLIKSEEAPSDSEEEALNTARDELEGDAETTAQSSAAETEVFSAEIADSTVQVEPMAIADVQQDLSEASITRNSVVEAPEDVAGPSEGAMTASSTGGYTTFVY